MCDSSLTANATPHLWFQLHDLATADLAARLGGSKTGLLNATTVRDNVLFK
jgi:hypothetical protein